ncbi:hypothetical protein PNK_0339 [Candidatus Protochlamydia naegleriophila]|uniref:Type III secretion system needle protein SctF n=1 Tax=Candidatus Protochlamydia naegleriophila TaxID=389348 RepID=A0A0U5J876_9BACT|nr:DUF5407 domain-containing protein [Candidatus Protochlamydia naegleriophila]CUI15976.1 hypothetical protein PNK_0339 [Candidatus Protochlamydia naegleriophila]
MANGAGYTTGGGSGADFQGNYVEQGFKVDFLISIVNDATVSAKRKLEILKARRSSISIADMFDMQMLMNHLSQLSEMSTAVVSASNSAISSMARNVKG